MAVCDDALRRKQKPSTCTCHTEIVIIRESSAVQLVDLLADHGLSCRVNTPTHDQGGLLDVVVTRDDLPAPSVDIVDVGLSDHRLLRWQVPMSRPSPVYNATVVRPWRLLDRDLFRQELMSSQLCNSELHYITLHRNF